MRKKLAVILIFLLLNSYLNIFAEVYQRDDMGDLSDKNTEYVATNAQAKKTEDIAEKDTKEVEIKIEDGIVNVSFPANIHAYLDPGNLSGKGQVFSDSYVIKNYGNTDLSIKIKNIDINYWSDEYEYEFSKEKITATPSQVKRLNVDMVWENKREKKKNVLNILDSEPNQYVLSLKAAKYSKDGEFIGLNEGSIGSFYFTGTLNANPNLVWEDGEITLGFDYEIVSDRDKEITNELLDKELDLKENNRDDIPENIEFTNEHEKQNAENNNKKEERDSEDSKKEELKGKEQEIREDNEKIIEENKEAIEDNEIMEEQKTLEDNEKIENTEELEEKHEEPDEKENDFTENEKQDEKNKQDDEVNDKEIDSETIMDEKDKELEKINNEKIENTEEKNEEISIEPTSKIKDEEEPVVTKNTAEGLEDSIETK